MSPAQLLAAERRKRGLKKRRYGLTVHDIARRINRTEEQTHGLLQRAGITGWTAKRNIGRPVLMIEETEARSWIANVWKERDREFKEKIRKANA